MIIMIVIIKKKREKKKRRKSTVQYGMGSSQPVHQWLNPPKGLHETHFRKHWSGEGLLPMASCRYLDLIDYIPIYFGFVDGKDDY